MSHIHWTIGVGDPSVPAWFLVGAYFVSALLCGAASTLAHGPCSRRDLRFWRFAFAMLVALGINKQLDIQSLLTESGRVLAKAEGWYGARRFYQSIFVAAVAVSGVVMAATLAWKLRGRGGAVKVAIAGLTCQMCFVVIRAASFHHVDVFLNGRTLGARWTFALELLGIIITGSGAARYVHANARKPGAE